MKNIVVCCDGTANEWTTPDKTSNVVQLFCMLDKDPSYSYQVRYYDPGVGTRGYAQSLDWFDQATGWSVDENVKQAYEFLMNFYEDGDRIFLFGFSRGAFTVRVLSGLIAKSGLLYKRNENLIEYAFKIFKKVDNSLEAKEFRENLSREIEIEFLGVWDTVSAVIHKATFGRLPRFFEDTILSAKVRYACQAISIDDLRRTAFKPILWGPIEPITRMEQVWFSGAHSDVGGGYPEDNFGRRAARNSLQWMIKRAVEKGLLLDASVKLNQIAKPDDSFADIHRPDRRLPWILLSIIQGYRKIPLFEQISGSGERQLPRVHESVFRRIKAGIGYSPRNLPNEFDIVDDDGKIILTVNNLGDEIERVKYPDIISHQSN